MADQINLTEESLKSLAKVLSETYSKTDELRSAQDRYTKTLKELRDHSKGTTSEVQKYTKAVASAREELKKMYEITKQSQKVMKDIEDQYESSTKGLSKYKDAIGKTIGGFRSMGSAATKYTAILGAQTLSMNNAVKSTLDYHNSMFRLSRTQQVSGRGANDFSKALAQVKGETVLSTNQFLSMADSVSKVFIGIKPTASSMADMAKMLQSQFGPNADMIREKYEELAGVQRQFPALYEQIAEGMKLVEKAKAGDKGAQAELEDIKERSYLLAENAGLADQYGDTILKALTPTTAAQDKENELQKKYAEVTKNSENAVLALGRSAEDVMLKAADAASKLYGWIEKLAPAAGIAAAAFAGLDLAMNLGLGAAAITRTLTGLSGIGKGVTKLISGMGSLGGGLTKNLAKLGTMGRLTTSLGAAGAIAGTAFASWELGKFLDQLFGISDLVDKIWNRSGSEAIFSGVEEDIKKYSEMYGDAFTKTFKELGGEQAKGTERWGKAQEAVRKVRREQEAVVKVVKEQPKTLTTLMQEQRKHLANQEKFLGITGQITEAMNSQVTISESFGQVNRRALENVVAGRRLEREQLAGVTKDLIEINKLTLKKYKMPEMDLAGKSDTEKLMMQQEALQASLKDTAKTDAQRLEINGRLLQINQQLAKVAQTEQNIIEAKWEKDIAGMKQMEQYSSAYESRLNTERKLMESAQFGLGASVEMMQKQVDLAQKFMQEYKKTDQVVSERVKKDHGLTQEQLEQIQNAKTQGEAQAYIVGVLGKTEDAANDLLKYAYTHQQLKDKEMQQQQKILEITKEVREGYLSAMKQMAFGFGQFGKIIGTQTRGAKQLMDLTKKVTGQTVLNTQAMGGTQSRAATQAGLGTQVTATYGTQGYQSGITKGEESARMGRIWKYQESVDRTRRGEVAAPPIGTGVAARDQDWSAMMGTASKRQGGGTVTAPQPSGNVSTNLWEKSGSFTPGAVLPGQQGIPPNYSGGPAAAALGAEIMQGSKGQISVPSGGPVLNTSSPLSKMIEQQQTTNEKLDMLISSVESGLAVNIMNSA